ncbi:MAG TPA: cytochrome P450 [Pseudonocardiaceae bacterium]|jgi:cytochrome P450|nr:cytochrome P450 [Pseudonocardiaceae bacterium]
MTATSQEATPYPFAVADRLNVHPKLAELRRDQPILRVTMPYGGDAWLATRYDDVKTVLADPRFSMNTLGRDVPRPVPLVQNNPSILTMDPPEHSRLRKLVAKAFTARRIELLRPRTQQIVDDLLDTMIPTGSPADLAESLNWPLPITVICELLGVPFADRDRFRQWTDLLLALVGDEDEIRRARQLLNEYLAGLIAVRRGEPSDDLLGELVAARDDEGRLSEEELVTFGVTLLVAGHETTANQTGNFVYLLLANPGLWDQLVADPTLVPSAVEELLRIVPLGASAGFPRIATEDLELGGQHIAAGESVVVDMNSANRDESAFERPEEVDLARADNQHVTFGHGIHHCLGAQLARMEMQVAIATLIRRLPTLHLAQPAEQVEWKTGRLIRGVRSLPVAW